MAGPGATEVGRVAIRVLPDTEGFAKKLKKDLEQIEKQMRIEIPVSVDTTKAKAELAALNREIAKFRDVTIDVSVVSKNVKLKGVREEAITLRKLFDRIPDSIKRIGSSIKLNLIFGFHQLKDSIKNISLERFATRVARGFEAIRTSAIKTREAVKDLSTSGVERFATRMSMALDKIKTQGERFKSGLFSEINLERDVKRTVAGAVSSVKNLGTALKDGFKNAGPHLKNAKDKILDFDFSLRRTRKTLAGLGKTIGGFAGLIGKGLTLPFSMTIGLLGKMSRVGAIVVAVLGAIPIVVGPIAGLLAGIPSLLFALGAGVAAVGLGMDGIKKAFAPLADDVDRLKKSVSATFEKQLTPQVKRLEKLFPILDKGLNQVAVGLSAMLKGFVDSVTSAEGMAQINRILQNTAKFFKDLAPFVKTFTDSLLILGDVGAQNFGFITQTLVAFGNEFKAVIKELAASGAFTEAFKGLAAVFRGLFDVFIDLFKSGIQVLATIGKPLGEALSSIGDLFVAIMPTLGEFAKAILIIVKAIADALVPVFNDLAPTLAEFAGLFVDLLVPIIKELAAPLGAIVKVFAALFKALSPLFPVLAQIANVFGNVLLAALKALEPVWPVLKDAIEKIANVISTTLKDSGPTLEKIGTLLGEVIAGAVEGLAQVVPPLVEVFGDFVDAVLPLIPPLLQLIKDVMPSLIEVFKNVVIPLAKFGLKITEFLIPILQWLIDKVSKVIDWLADFAAWVSRGIDDAIAAIKKLKDDVIKAFDKAATWLVEAGKDVIRGFIQGIKDMVNGAIQQVRDYIQRIKDGITSAMESLFRINSPSKYMRDLAMQIPEGVDDGLEKGFKKTNDTFDRLTGDLRARSQLDTNVNGMSHITIGDNNITDAVSSALSQWDVVIDRQGIAKMVNRANAENRKR